LVSSRSDSPARVRSSGALLPLCGSVLAGLALAALPHPAAACLTQTPPPALEGYPRDGSVDVPTDVIPVFDGSRIGSGASMAPAAVFELKTDAGETIALTTQQPFVWHFELVPASALAPRTRYTVRSKPAGELSLSFTTGDGPLAGPPAGPRATMQHYTSTGGPGTSCDPSVRATCIAHTGGDFVEYVFTNGTTWTQPYLRQDYFWANLTGFDQGTSLDCVRLRTRAANGRLSDPVLLCGKDALHHALPTASGVKCDASGLTYKGKPAAEFPLYPVAPPPRVADGGAGDGSPVPTGASTTSGSSSSGCSYGGSRGAAPLGLVLAALVALCRRRRG
jgi:hypothetical protein